MIPDWLKPLLFFFDALAWIGLALSLLSHLAALLGFREPLGDYAWFLHIGVFVVGLPVVLVAARMSAEFKNKDTWKAILRGCPPWMKYMLSGFFAYAFVNFAVLMLAMPRGSGSGPMTPRELRWFSGGWMAFYSAAAATLYSAIHSDGRDRARRCVNGHAVGPLAQFCEQCGQPVVERP